MYPAPPVRKTFMRAQRNLVARRVQSGNVGESVTVV
jgi:hypothetical protein